MPLMRILLFMLAVTFGVQLNAHTSYPVKIHCPLDSTEFEIWVTGSYTTTRSKKDFQKQGYIGDLYESSINSCPKCHFSGYKKDFDTTYTDTTRAALLQLLAPYAGKNKIDDVKENEIAAQIHLYFHDKNDRIANIYLVASYFLRDSKDRVEERKELQRKTITYLQKAIEAKEYKQNEYATIDYLIAELYRRTGDFENAITYYDRAISDPDKASWIEKLAQEQRQLAVDKNDDNSI